MKWVQLCGSLNILWHCPSLGMEWKLIFSSSVATAEFSKFAGILNAALPHHHLLGFETAQLEFITSTSFFHSDASYGPEWISELKCTGMGEFNSDDHYIYYCRQESLRRKALMVNKRVWNAALGCNLKDDRKISVHFQGKPLVSISCEMPKYQVGWSTTWNQDCQEK